MLRTKFIRRASLSAMLLALLFAAGCGCDKKPEAAPAAALPTVPRSRFEDPAFKASVQSMGADQRRAVARRNELEARIAALKGKSESAEELKRLQEELKACQAECDAKLAKIRAAGRTAIQQQAADKAAVEAGRAVYATEANKDK